MGQMGGSNVVDTGMRTYQEGAFTPGSIARIVMKKLPNCCNGGFIISQNTPSGDDNDDAIGYTAGLAFATAEHLQQCMGLQDKAILIAAHDQDHLLGVLKQLAEKPASEFRAIRLAKWSAEADLWMLRR